jgi:hypothetical protein
VRKGGQKADTEGRLCLCNGLLATAGHAQVRTDGDDWVEEPPLLTLGQDLDGARRLLEAHPQGWSAADVMAWLTAAIPTP